MCRVFRPWLFNQPVEIAHVKVEAPAVIGVHDIREVGSKHDVFGQIEIVRIDALHKRTVDAGDIHDETYIVVNEVLGIEPLQRALLIDRMNDRPAHQQQWRAGAQKIQVVQSSHSMPFLRGLRKEHADSDGGVDDFASAAVCHPEYETRDAIALVNYDFIGKNEAGGWPRKLGKDNSRCECHSYDADKRLQGHYKVCEWRLG